MTKLIVPNQADPVVKPSELEQRVTDGIVTTKFSVSFQVARGSGKEQTLDVNNTDVVELELDDGQKLWVRVDELERDFGVTINRSGAGDDGSVRIPRELPSARTSRGLGTWVIKGLKVLGVDIAGSIGEFLSGKVEGKQSPGPGLYGCTAASANDLQPVASLDRSKPILVFLHGTASSTEGSFGALWQEGSSYMADLLNHYDDQVLAFQHSSLTMSPIENALALMQAITALSSTVVGKFPLRLHLVSHSRGGLIGELLCRGTKESGSSFDDDDLGLFTNDHYARDKTALEQLRTLLDETDLHVERFMRVACPARGTTLADGRLDRYLSGIVNILGKIPGVANPVFDGVSSLLLAVVHKRTEPEELPGLEAMMPTSPTVRMLNRPDITVTADLHVIGGDVMASGFVNRLKVMMTDLFYREDHDLVVNTPSMFGGASRKSGVRYWVDTGSEVNHFRYFANSTTASRLTTGLLQPENIVFRTLDTEPHQVSADDYRKRSIAPQPIVFVLPGIMGSHLSIDDDRVWLDYLQIACGGMTRLGIDASAPPVQPEALLGDAYGELMKFLAATHDVRPFAYDWRLSISQTAERFHKVIETALEEAHELGQPVRILAHSMGGLVVRAMLATPEGAQLWRRMSEHPGARFIMLGTPNGGSHAIAAMLMGRDALVRKLALLDIKNNYAELLRTIVRFDGALQLLPHKGTLDLFDRSSWDRIFEHDVPDKRGVFSSSVAGSESAGIGWTIPDGTQLEQAARVRDLILGSPIDPERTIYVAGVAPATPVDVTIDATARSGRQVQVHATAEGDSRVPWSTGIPATLPPRNVYYMDAIHGDMAATVETFPALLQLLEEGATHQLSNNPIVSRGRVGETFILPPTEPEMYPDRADLVAAALGGTRHTPRPPTEKCHVRIVHGNLARSRFPVTVGHYDGDAIVSAEDYLDRQLDGKLRERHRLGIYPGKKGTSTILLNWPDQYELERRQDPIHPGAIVIGLGNVGDLAPGALTSTLVDGLMRYALEVRDTTVERYRQQKAESPQTLSAPLTSLLISASNDMTVNDSLLCILRAVAVVNQRLQPPPDKGAEEARTGAEPYVRIDQLDIIEYWEDRAIQATRALVNLSSTAEFADVFDFHRQVVEGKDGKRRASFDDGAGWWQRMRISTLDSGDLKFETLTERARVESNLQSSQRNLVDRFLSRAAASPTYDPSLGKTLFELVMPNQLKQYAPDRRNLILMLDEKAAAYPWELLHDGAEKEGRPMAVQSGVIRQLISGEFRPKPLMSQELTALVVGDPVADDMSGTVFPPLPGAAIEARQVSEQLIAAAYDTVTLIGEDARPLDVVTKLYERPYRIVHIAAHGVFDLPVDDRGQPVRQGNNAHGSVQPDEKRMSGVVLGDGIYLTPSEFEQMRNVPELVFINCCHLGKLSNGSTINVVEYHRLAANVATQLIRMGVRAVIAAGWAVDDDAAKLFARTFYERLLSSNTFGDSVSAARRATYDSEARRSGNTWGAYQCYGDPDFTLKAREPYRTSGSAKQPLSPSELKQDLEELAKDAAYASEESVKTLKKALEQMVKVTPGTWYESGSVCSAIATAYAELGQLEEAAGLYQKANVSDRTDASIASLEQMVNMKTRWAIDLATGADATDESKERALKELTEAENFIDALLKINGSQERYAIKGAVHKRMARLADVETQQDQLRKMVDAYGRAYEIGVEKNLSTAFYPLQNSLAARIAFTWCIGAKNRPTKNEIVRDLQQLEQYLDDADMRDADFWMACQKPDLLLLKALNQQELSQTEEGLPQIREAYESARKRGATVRELKSIIEHLQFFLSVAKMQMRDGPKKEKLCAGIEALMKTMER